MRRIGIIPVDFYDQKGNPFAYTDDGSTIHTFSGKPIGYIDGVSIYTFSGKHVGFFEDGQVWDHSGCVVLFTDASIGGPIKPLKSLRPLKGIKQNEPLKKLKNTKPQKPSMSQSWSDLSPGEFFDLE